MSEQDREIEETRIAGKEIEDDRNAQTLRATGDEEARPSHHAPLPLPDPTYMVRLRAFAEAKVNYELATEEELTDQQGWHIDSYDAELPPEPTGPPINGGSFAIAADIARSYRFVDPSLIRGYFDPDAPLLGRIVLQRVRVFGILKFEFAVRVVRVIDDVVEGERRWGYAYRTLAGHYEQGELTFLVTKEEESGRVHFRMRAYSRLGHIPNIILRIGARLFARPLQVRFARYALRRMQEMVTERLMVRDVVEMS